MVLLGGVAGLTGSAEPAKDELANLRFGATTVEKSGPERRAMAKQAMREGTAATLSRMEGRDVLVGTSRRVVYEKAGAAVAVESKALVRLREELDREWNYGHEAKLCGFAPLLAADLVSGAQVVQVRFCFSCDDVMILIDGKDVDFRPLSAAGRARFVALFRELFPLDQQVQSLPSENPHRTNSPSQTKP